VLEDRAGPEIPETGKKDLAMTHRRKFSNEFKRQVVEEHLSGVRSAVP
jgi:transposase-like protein